MKKELLDQLIALGINRPIVAHRMIGNRRIEVHCLGDYEPTIYDLGGEEEEKKAAPAEGFDPLEKKTIKQLRELATEMKIKVTGLRKAAIIEKISSRKK